jgi:hypothetical protein
VAPVIYTITPASIKFTLLGPVNQGPEWIGEIMRLADARPSLPASKYNLIQAASAAPTPMCSTVFRGMISALFFLRGSPERHSDRGDTGN